MLFELFFSQSCPVLSAASVSGATKRKRTSAVPLGTQPSTSSTIPTMVPDRRSCLRSWAVAPGAAPAVRGSQCGRRSAVPQLLVSGCEWLWGWARHLGRPVRKTWLHTDSGPAPKPLMLILWNSRDFPMVIGMLFRHFPNFTPLYPRISPTFSQR